MGEAKERKCGKKGQFLEYKGKKRINFAKINGGELGKCKQNSEIGGNVIILQNRGIGENVNLFPK